MFRSSCTRFLKDNNVIQALENHWITGKCSTCFSYLLLLQCVCDHCPAEKWGGWCCTVDQNDDNFISYVLQHHRLKYTSKLWQSLNTVLQVRRCSLLYLSSDLLFAYWWWFESKIQIYFITASWKQFSRSIYDGSAEVSNSLKTKSNEWGVARNFCTIMYEVIVSENQGKQKG